MMKLLGIDLGTSSVKVLITDQNGSILSRGREDYPLLTPRPGWVEQDPHDWWQATVLAARQAISGLKDDARIGAIGFSGQMHGTVLLDNANHLLHKAIIWPDQRSSHQVEGIKRLVSKERLIEITGSLAATGFQSATLRWMQKNIDETWAKTRRVLLPKDYLRWRLCGEFATDSSDASGTGLLDGEARTWSQELLSSLQIDPRLLPVVKPSNVPAGRLLPAAARELGLPEGIPVVVGAADTAASLLGAGVTGEHDLLVTISTGGQLITPTRNFVTDRLGRLHTFCSAVEPDQHLSGWYLMGATLSAGQSLRWLRDNVLKISAHGAYSQMVSLAEQSAVGSDGLFFTPYLSGDRTADGETGIPGAYVGLTIRHGRSELVRAILEGVVYSLYEKYLVLVENGLRPERIILAGGGARSQLWTQILADVFGLPMERLLVEEQSAYGAALLAGAGIGLFDVEKGAQEWVKLKGGREPNMKTHAQYQELLPIFREVCLDAQSVSRKRR